MPENVVIIGSGPAGWTAAIYAARASLNPILFEGAYTEENRVAGTLPLGQLATTTEVENYPGFPSGDLTSFLDTALPGDVKAMMLPHEKEGVSGPELMELMRQQAKNFGTRVITDDITKVNFSQRPFTLFPLSEEPIEAKTVIVATGARANWLGLPSEEAFKNRGVSACAVCDGALPRFRNKPLAVIGGGDSAIEEADYLSKFAEKVYLVHRRDEFRASKIMAQRAKEHPKLDLQLCRTLEEVLGDDEKGVTGIRLASTIGEETIELAVSGLFLSIGHTPNTAFLEDQLATNDQGYIELPVSHRTNTSVEGVFAAGDVADDYYRQAITSAGSGCQAALDAERYLASLE